MSNPDQKTNARFLPDIQSQRLCLQDALRSPGKAPLLHALRAVAEARGITKLARELGLGAPALMAVLAGEKNNDPSLVADLISHVLAIIATAETASGSAKMVKSRRAGGKTGPVDER